METVGTIRATLVFSHPPGNSSASAVVLAVEFDALNTEKERLGCETAWVEATDPETGNPRPALTPIEGGRLAMIESRGIRHGDRFIATIDINEVNRSGRSQRQMWLVNAEPL